MGLENDLPLICFGSTLDLNHISPAVVLDSDNFSAYGQDHEINVSSFLVFYFFPNFLIVVVFGWFIYNFVMF